MRDLRPVSRQGFLLIKRGPDDTKPVLSKGSSLTGDRGRLIFSIVL